MQQEIITIQNLKCGGCVKSVMQALKAFPEVSDVQVSLEDATVTIQTTATEKRAEFEAALSQAGYPPVGAANPLHRVAKSFVSCAIGRMS